MSRETNKTCVSGVEERRSLHQIVSVLHNKTEKKENMYGKSYTVQPL
jgi:hypothetical protein